MIKYLRVRRAADAGYAPVVELADTMDLGSIARACGFKSCRAHHSEMTFGYQAAAQSAPASTAKVFLRSKSWPLTLGHDFVFEAIDLRCSSTDFVSR